MQCISKHCSNSHSCRRINILISVSGFRVFSKCDLQSSREFYDHIVDTTPLGLHKHKLTSNHIGTPRACHHGSNSGFNGIMKCRVHRVNTIDCPQRGCGRIRLLITIVSDYPPFFFRNPNVGMRFNEPGHHPGSMYI